MNSKLVTIIIPAFNRCNLILNALDSVVAQSHRPIEIIVADDGSTDDTSLVVAKWAKEIEKDKGIYFVYIHQENSGPGDARNLGLSKASGSYVLFLDSDDCLLENSLSDLIAETPRSDVVIGGAIQSERTKNSLNQVFLPAVGSHESALNDYLSGKLSINCGCWLLNMDLVRASPLFPSAILKCEDSIYFLNIIVRSSFLTRIQRPVIQLRDHYHGRLTDLPNSPSMLRASAMFYTEQLDIVNIYSCRIELETKSNIIDKSIKIAIELWTFDSKLARLLFNKARAYDPVAAPRYSSKFGRFLWRIGGFPLCAFVAGIRLRLLTKSSAQ